MSKILPEKFKEPITALRQLITATAIWIVAPFLTWLIPRNSDLLTIIGRSGFSDNSKYFFIRAALWAAEKPVRQAVFLTGDRVVLEQINEAGGEAIFHPSVQSLWLLLRCGVIATDVSIWFDYGAFPLTLGAKRIQMWHGAPLKHIELAEFERRLSNMSPIAQALLKIHKQVIGRYPKYDGVVATSKSFITAAFASSFRAKEFLATGYPRNDILLKSPAPGTLAERLALINVDTKAIHDTAQARANGQLVCLYAPTFRKDMGRPFDTVLDLGRLSEFAVRHRMLIVMKLHPFLEGKEAIGQYSNLMEYEASADVYPLMPQVDLLITDYSSIFFDFLLLDRPIIFLIHDLENYLQHDRAMYFDFDSMTPGAKCRNQADLENVLMEIQNRSGADDYVEQRHRIRSFTHDWTDSQSAERLLTHYVKNGGSD